MNNKKVRLVGLVLDVVKAAAMLLSVCCAILFSVEILFDVDIFSIKRVFALAVLCESLMALRSVV